MGNKPSVVIDTNVFISSLFGGNTSNIINLFLNEEIYLFYSLEILDEYRGVFFRNKFSHISKRKRKILLEAIVNFDILILPERRISKIIKDPSDNKFLECAVSAKAEYLITGNIHHFNFERFEDIKVVSPIQFLNEL